MNSIISYQPFLLCIPFDFCVQSTQLYLGPNFGCDHMPGIKNPIHYSHYCRHYNIAGRQNFKTIHYKCFSFHFVFIFRSWHDCWGSACLPFCLGCFLCSTWSGFVLDLLDLGNFNFVMDCYWSFWLFVACSFCGLFQLFNGSHLGFCCSCKQKILRYIYHVNVFFPSRNISRFPQGSYKMLGV